jgi:hypothetical protein
MKALIFENKVVDVQETEFEAHESMVWVDCADDVEAGFAYEDGVFISNQPTAEESAAMIAEVEAKAAAKAAGNQKLLDLGLTQEEATALTGYVPPSE